MTINECYQCLETPPTASAAEVRQAYKKLVKAWHPDRFEADSSMKVYAEERLKIINAAYDQLRKHLSAIKTEQTENGADKQAWSFGTTAAPRCDIPGSIVRLRKLIFSIMAEMGAAWQSMLSSPGSSNVHQHENRKTLKETRKHPKSTQSFQKNKEKRNLQATAGLKKMHGRTGVIYNKRDGYGPRSGKGLSPVAGIAAVEKSQAVSAIPKIAPIRRIN